MAKKRCEESKEKQEKKMAMKEPVYRCRKCGGLAKKRKKLCDPVKLHPEKR